MQKNLTTIIGFIGMILIVGAYFLNSYGFVASAGLGYLSMNLIGSTFVGIDVYAKKVWSAVTLQVIWILITLSALYAMGN